MITEFGCGAHAGADRTGPAGFLIVQWFRPTPRVHPATRATSPCRPRYLRELIEVFEAEGVHGAFVFTFAMPDFPHRPDDPEHDLDMAGFGVVKVAPGEPARWSARRPSTSSRGSTRAEDPGIDPVRGRLRHRNTPSKTARTRRASLEP